MRKLMVCAALAGLLSTTTPGFAFSPETDGFIANIRLSAVFLAQSSKIAVDHSENSALQSFASNEIDAQDAILAAIDLRAAPEVAQDLPMTVAANDVQTGRSAAVTTAVASDTFAAPSGTGALMPAASITLDHLSSAKGDAFDTLYKSTQINALRQLAALYNAYALTGDDDRLRQIAKTELSATDRAIAEIARF